MRQVIAILGDSFRESVDRKSLLILLGLSLLPILFCFGLSFEREPMDDILRRQGESIGKFARHRIELETLHWAVGEVTAVGDPTPRQFRAELAGGHFVPFTFDRPSDLDALAVQWFRRAEAAGFDDGDNAPTQVDGVPRGLRYLEQRFASLGYGHAQALPGDAPGEVLVAVRSDHPDEVRGAHRLHAAFGLVNVPLPGVSVAEFVILLQQGLGAAFVGFLGMIIALSACSAFVPNMLQKGSLDLLLARPISRTKLLLTKYVGGLWFVFCLATFLVVGCWLGLVVGIGYSSPWFLASIPILTAAFAVLYSVSVLIGTWTRSSGLSGLVALGVWFASSSVVSVRHGLRGGMFNGEVPEWLTHALEVAYTVLPKVKDLDILNTHALAQSHLSDDARERLFRREMPDVDWVFSLGTTAAFTALMLALAVWVFRRRDY